MGQGLFKNNKIFKDTINRLNSYLPDDMDLIKLFEEGDKWFESIYSTIGITVVQIGLCNIIKVKIIPDNILGHSMGEIAASYMDGCLDGNDDVCLSDQI